MSEKENNFNHLKELGKSKYEIADGESDIRGWTVKNEHGVILGEVFDLILNTEAGKIDYIIVDLDRNELHLRERNVLLPIEFAEINETQKNVIFPGVMANELTNIPTYEKGKLSRNSIEHISHVFSGTSRRQDSSLKQASSSTIANQSRETPVGTQPPYTPTDHFDNRISEPGSSSRYKVIGIFEHISLAPEAVDQLVKNGFAKADIAVLNKTDVTTEGESERNHQKILTYFNSMLSNEEEKALFYTQAALRGSIVTVDASSLEKAEKAATILDDQGTIDIDIIVQTKQSGNATFVSSSKFDSKKVFRRKN